MTTYLGYLTNISAIAYDKPFDEETRENYKIKRMLDD